MKTEKAKETLQKKGWYTGNLWHVRDVMLNYPQINEDEAYAILDEVLESEQIQSHVFEMIGLLVPYSKLNE